MDYKLSLLSVLLVSAFTAAAGQHSNSNQCVSSGHIQNPSNGVCTSVDIRNNISSLQKLEHCRVIEGSLHISLIDAPDDPKEYENYSFPNLVEITDHLMLYRVMGLRTLGHLFPNLTVIRGHLVFTNYALVAYEMSDLEEVGLHSLRVIGNGGVRLTKNKKLCYVHTVDWIRIGANPDFLDFKDNRIESRCVNQCPANCHRTLHKGKDSPRCWNQNQCQKGLSCQCKDKQACMANGSCCHEYCLGGCTGPGPGDCLSCKGVVYMGKCQPQCPPETYKFYNRRCLRDKECLELPTAKQKKSKILRGDDQQESLCLYDCKDGFAESEEGQLKSRECVKCKGFCPKECAGVDINSLEDAMKLKGCSKIKGPIIIQIIGGSNVAQQLEEFLGNIKEVTGYISIRRSYALLTLYFFKSLEIIRGESDNNLTHSFLVMDNSNLQELFPKEQMKRMVIKNGRVSFHSNRKLCFNKIQEFISLVNMTQGVEENDISKSTNGDLKPCSEHYLNLTVDKIYEDSVVLKWEKDTADARHLLSYIVNYKEIKDKERFNVDIFQGRDACSDDVWMSKEQTPTSDDKPEQMTVIFPLKPYTTYAIYVQAYTLNTAAHSAMTNVLMFTTQPSNPSEPLNVQVFAESPGELRVTWKPPKYPNGNVTHYKVMYREQVLDADIFEQRNYCQHPILYMQEETVDEVTEVEKVQNFSANCCSCPKSEDEKDEEKRAQDAEIFFEDYLQKQVYCKRFPDGLPPWIEIGEEYDLLQLVHSDFSNTSTRKQDVENHETTTAVSRKPKKPVVSTHKLMEMIINGTEAILPNLRHFQEYSIQIQACHDTKVDKYTGESKALCSPRALSLGRTKYIPEKDSMNTSQISVEVVANSTGDVIIRWKPPRDPNGLILKYNLYYTLANKDNHMPQRVCVTIRQYKEKNGFSLMGLGAGNWTFQIKPVSLAGNGTLTPERYFIIPEQSGERSVNKTVIAVAVICFIVFTVLACIISYACIKNRVKNSDMTVISPNMNYVPSEQMYIIDDWEVDRDNIKLIKELGKGSFGMVYEGIAKGIGQDPNEEIRVAVKTVNDRASFNDKREFLKEATTMKAFDCYHVVKLLGVVSTGQPPLVIMELMARGDLKEYLRQHRPDEDDNPGVVPLTLMDILQMAGEIADGMAYLADKKFVHRDLAARNCMVAEDRTVKVGDFGMTRDIYETDYYRKGGGGKLPIRWMPPESLRDGVFTTMSDVWSYGVVMWEMVTLAAQPYQGMSNEGVVRFVSEGNIMETPEKCPEEMAQLMERCWSRKPKDRPTFKSIIEYLMPHLSSRFEELSYFFSEGGGGPSEGDGLVDLCDPNPLYLEPELASEDGEEDLEESSLFLDSPSLVGFASHPQDSMLHLPPASLASSSGEEAMAASHNPRFELQPLINKDPSGGHHSSVPPLLSHHQQPSPSLSSSSSNCSSPAPPTDSPLSKQHIFNNSEQTLPLGSAPLSDNSLGSDHRLMFAAQQSPPASASTSTKGISRPTLRLPTLNQPPGGGFQRRAAPSLPAVSTGVSQWSPAGGDVVSMEEGRSETSPTQAAAASSLSGGAATGWSHEDSSPPGAIVSSSEGSKESTKSSSDSHSLLNGLTNGHIPISSIKPNTAPC